MLARNDRAVAYDGRYPDLVELYNTGPSPVELDNLSLNETEKLLIRKVIDKYGGNISKAAKELGLTRASLYRRIEKHGLYREPLAIPHPFARPLLSLAFRLGMSSFPVAELDFIRYVCMVDGRRAAAELGFRAQFGLRETIRAVEELA